MSPEQQNLHQTAVRRLLTATMFWGISFIMMKSLMMISDPGYPSENSWFIAGSSTASRFLLAALVLGLISISSLRRLTWLEIYQGLGLGISAGFGMLFQLDGIHYTSASTSAFLTQTYCIILPFIIAARDRAWPRPRVWISCLMVLAGVALLGNVDFQNFRLGRGEIETLTASLIFAVQVLWLERPIFRANNVANFSIVMFVCIALASLPIALFSGTTHDWSSAAHSWKFWVFVLILSGPCTLYSFVTMNKWQPHIPAMEAALIYGAEPVWASLFALFLPAWVSRWTALNYTNEPATWFLLAGGGLISAANFLLQTSKRPTGEPDH
jgi:drug/metabolite transporter (DMT)-like permease